MSFAYHFVTSSIKIVTGVLCNIDGGEISKIPSQGPLIIVSNHINFLEVPLLYTHLQPRIVTGFAKAETWNNPIMATLFNLWGAIPLQRGEADTKAFREALEAIQQGKILAIAPEGTRSGNGKLQQGHPGIILLAQKSKAPILPLVYYGGEKLQGNLNRFRRTDFHIRVGELFYLSFPDGKIGHDVRAEMLNQIMYQLAQLLPNKYRGYYADLTKMASNYLNFV